jgi:hypothetical protein
MGGGVKWRTGGRIDQATGQDDWHFVRENQPPSPFTPRDVKNEDRTDYVYENIRKETKCIPFNFTLIAQNLTDCKAIDENRAAYRLKLRE